MSIFNSLRSSTFLRCVSTKIELNKSIPSVSVVNLRILPTFHLQTRDTSFFNKLPAEQLWKGVTSVSNAGRKRGRGKGSGRKVAKDLNRGQVIGIGKTNIVWPGLTVPILRGREIVSQHKLPEDPDRTKKLIELRDKMGQFKRFKLSPIERGWSGNKLHGRSVGPPDPIGEDHFDGFDTKALEVKAVTTMTGNMGRKRTMSVFVVTGNRNGLAGFGLGRALEGKSALTKAKNRAGQRLMYIERYNDHTVCHDFFAQFNKTKIFVQKKPEGYGLKCHRAIKCICEVIGIKDMYAKVEGSTNLQNIVKAFFIGLLKQKTHSELADKTGLNVVEMKSERDFYPEVIAKPSILAPKSKASIEFQEYIMDGKVVYRRKKFPPFYTNTVGYEKHLLKTLRYRNMNDVKINLLAERGSLKSFLTVPEENEKSD